MTLNQDKDTTITDLLQEITRLADAKAYWRGVAEAATAELDRTRRALTAKQREKLDAAP